MKKYYKKAEKEISWKLRKVTSRLRKLPDFIIVGAMKSGTTSLYRYVCEHPEIHPALEKEIMFFDHKFNKGIDWYKSHFPIDLDGSKTTGEASTSYLSDLRVPRRIKKVSPSTKVVAILRDPVERAYSHYRHMIRTGREDRSFEDAIKDEMEYLKTLEDIENLDFESKRVRIYSYLLRSIYYPQVKKYANVLGKQNIMLIKAEDMFEDPKLYCNKIFSFVGIKDYEVKNTNPKNVAEYDRIIPKENYLRRYFDKHNKKLKSVTNYPIRWET